jgi:hypothetical protein
MTDTPGVQPVDAVRTLAEDLTKVVLVAKSLVEAGHRIDLTGLTDQVGLLCATSLDLPTEEGRSIRPKLIALSGTFEALVRALQKAAPCSSAPHPS